MSSSTKQKTRPYLLSAYGDEEKRIATIFNWFIVIMLVSLLAGIFILFANKNMLEAIVTGAASLPILIAVPWIRRRNFERAATLLAIVMIIMLTVLATHGQGVHNISLLGFPAVLIVASLVTRKRIMALLTIFCIACVAWLVFGDVYGIYTPNAIAHSIPGDFFSVSMILIATAVMVRMITELLFHRNRELQNELRERKLVEQALELSEKKFNEAFHISPVMMTIEGEDHKFIDVNQAFLNRIGYTREEVLGRTVSDLKLWASEEDMQRVRQFDSEQNGVHDLELSFRRKSGETGIVIISSNKFEANGIVYELTSGLDITERKQVEDALRESESRFRGYVENTTDGIFLCDSQGEIIEWNPAMERMTGLYRQQALGLPIWEIQMRFSPSEELENRDGEEIKSAYMQVFDSGILESRYEDGIETEVQHLNGVQRVVEQKMFLFKTTNGYVMGVLLHDITERRQMEDRLFEEKELAQVTLHSIGDAVITTNIHAKVEYLNPIAEQLTGWKNDEAVGRNLVDVFQVINEESRLPVIDPVERCLQEGRVVGLANHSILISRDGHEYSIDDSAAPIRNRKGEIIGTVLVFHDITEERRLSLQVAHDAMHDSLTGLINRREFEKRLERALISTKERNQSHVLCYLDLDQFKIVNDTAGHAAGDELLKQVSRLLSGLFRQRDTLARLGGDEFGLLLENCQLEYAVVICNGILSTVREFSFPWEGNSFHVSVSIGVVPITAEKESINQLLSQADIACYSAKDLGRNRLYVYQMDDRETVQRYSDILQAARMRDAIVREQFLLYCQPIVQLAGDQAGHRKYEVLLRMLNDEKDLVMPSVFIPPAERYGLMPAIDRWVIRQTFSIMARSDVSQAEISINLSGNSLNDDSLMEFVLQQLQEYSISPGQICFEITETAAIHHLNQAQKFIHEFREQGGKIALDDFGSGFSSFRYLKTLPVDYIKIDGVFVSGMLTNPGDQAMVEAITNVAHTLGINVIAEHASDQETVNQLRQIGVEGVQGFGIGSPVPVEVAWGRK